MSHHSVTPTINIFIIEGNKILLGRRSNTGWMDGMLCPPGGHVEVTETPIVGAIREAKEEVGLSLNPSDFDFIGISARNTQPRETIACSFMVRDKGVKPTNTEPGKCSELSWYDLDDLPADIIPDFREVIDQCVLGDKRYLEIGYK
jgi:8-oxo-dGTP diphosphatase